MDSSPARALPLARTLAFVQHVRRLPSDAWAEGIPRVLPTFFPPPHAFPLAEDKHWVPGVRNGVRTRNPERVKARLDAAASPSNVGAAPPSLPSVPAPSPVPPRPPTPRPHPSPPPPPRPCPARPPRLAAALPSLPPALANGSPGRARVVPSRPLEYHSANGVNGFGSTNGIIKQLRSIPLRGMVPRPDLTPLQEQYERERARQLAPASRSLAPPAFIVRPPPIPPILQRAANAGCPVLNVPNGSRPPTLDVRNITYHSLSAFLSGPPGPVVRLHHYKSAARLEWDGNVGSSGFSARTFRALSPEHYAQAMDAAQLGGRWGLGPGVRETGARHVLGQVSDEPSPWISATANLDSAIAVIARELAMGTPEVHLAVVLPTTEVRLPAADVLRTTLAKSPFTLQRSCGEWLFYGRIFAQSIVADIRWTRARLPFDLPPKFWKAVDWRDHSVRETPWIRHLRWDPKTAAWPSIRLILQLPPGAGWSTQPSAMQPWAWPANGSRAANASHAANVVVATPMRHPTAGSKKGSGHKYRRRRTSTAPDLLGDDATSPDCLGDSDGEGAALATPLDPTKLDLLEL